MEGKFCKHCRFLEHAESGNRQICICNNKRGSEKLWRVVYGNQTCGNFEMLAARQVEIEKFVTDDSVRSIALTQGQFAVVDSGDYDELAKYKWYAHKEKRNYYAVGIGENRKPVLMHRIIMDAPKGLFVDHIDHDGLNNRRENLRLCTKVQNNYNQRPHRCKRNRTKLKGVTYQKKTKNYIARIGFDGKRTHIGSYKTEEEAGRAYDKMAAELFGEFAYLNFPENQQKLSPSKPAPT